jgi:hypothetical protein
LPGQPVILDTFGGLVATARPEDIPEGASPRTWDTDFVVGRFIQRPGEQSVFTYGGSVFGPNGAASAVDTATGGIAWGNPTNVLLNTGVYATATLATSGSVVSSASTGTNTGGGVAWANPANIDSTSSFATVSLSAGGTNYTPSAQTGTVTLNANSSNQTPPSTFDALGGFASVAATAATLYVSINGSIAAAMGGGNVALNYSKNGGATWINAGGWGASFSTTVPISISGITNLSSVQIQIEASGGCGPTGFVTISASVTSWFGTVPGGGGLTAQTLSAAVSGLTVPSGATIVGLGISFQADYTGVAPSFMVGLNVGNVDPSFTLTTSPATYTSGGAMTLWGYGAWTQATLAALTVNFFASSTGTTSVSVNSLVVTVYYTATALTTDALDIKQFGFSIPSSSTIQGFAITALGFASTTGATLTAQLFKGGVLVGTTASVAMGTTVAPLILGNANDLFSASWLFGDVDASGFGVRLIASSASAGTISVGYVTITVYCLPSQANFNGLMDAAIDAIGQVTIALDADGVSWEEDVADAPTVLAVQSLIPPVTPGSYLKGLDADGVAYMAYPNAQLTTGANQPMQYNGQWCDRITQVGPGAPPTFTASQQAGVQAAVTAYSFSGGILTLTAVNTFTAGELVAFIGFTGGLVPLNGLTFSVLGTGLSGTQFEIATSLVAGAGSDAGFATPQYSYPIAPSPTGITQPPAYSDPGNAGYLSVMLWSNGPGSTTPGNVITVYYQSSFNFPTPDNTLVNAFTAGNPVYVYISNAPFGNGTWLVTSIGNALPPGVDHWRYYFTIQVPSDAYQNAIEPNGQYEISQATVTLLTAAPGVVPGDQVSLSGVTNTAWDQTYTIVAALTSGTFSISQSSLTAGTATYSWTLVSGVAPSKGQLVTITGTLNANGLLNVTNSLIVTASGVSSGTFTVGGLPQTVNYPIAVETGQATTAGTQFIIDPGAALVNTTTQSPILGNSGGGVLNVVGQASGGTFPIGAGTRQGVVGFVTRNGASTRPSPPSTFTVAVGSNYITASNIPLGPPNVVARYISFTEAGQNGIPGANFYTYDVPVTFTVAGVIFTASALIVPDNVTTTMKFTFSDAVLLSSDEIDVEGSNYFNLIELGNPAWMFQYANRMLYGLCQTKVQNFLNLTFDGGYLPTNNYALPSPLGWNEVTAPGAQQYTITAFQITGGIVTFTATNSLIQGVLVAVSGLTVGTYLNGLTYTVLTANGTQFTASTSHANVGSTSDSGTAQVTSSASGLVVSPAFGNSFVINNNSSTTQLGSWVLFQSAYQDAYFVAILQPNTAYSVRVTARALTASASSSIQIGLIEYSGGDFGTSHGVAAFGLTTGNLVIQTAPLTTGISVIPTTLQIALGIQSLSSGGSVEIDRIEIFPTNRPVDTTTIWCSYAGEGAPNFEAVDGVTGQLGCGDDNPQPTQGAYEILTQLFIEKTRSCCVTQDSPNYEPFRWKVPLSSNSVGAVGPNAFDAQEEFALKANRTGLYFFDGGKPQPIMRELQSSGVNGSIWELINWAAGSTLWLRNDTLKRRFYIGVPMITPNFYLPNAPASTPTQPNVILMCNYTGCPTAEELMESMPVHTTMFGDLKAVDMRRKWSIWQIVCPVAEFIQRGDGFTQELLLCNGIGSSKIYSLVNGAASGGQNTDDGAAINWLYTTYGFVKAKQGQVQPGLGALRKIAYYLTATMEGIGQVAGKLYSNSLGAKSQNTFTIPLPFLLSYPQQNDQERVLEIGGQCIFVEFSAIGIGGYAEIGPVILDMEADKNSPHRGVSS